MSKPKKIAILTGGGDCPGLNAAIRAIVKSAIAKNFACMGVMEGFKGLYEENFHELKPKDLSNILRLGGTILGTSRFNPLRQVDGIKKIKQNLKTHKIDVLVCIGGEGTMRLAHQLSQHGIAVIGVPKTIDNDVFGTDFTIGFSTAVHIATEAIDRLHTTAEAHNRIMIVEVMGRNTGWIATYAGLASGADVILIPEQPSPFSAIIDVIKTREKAGKKFTIICISEDAKIIMENKKILDTSFTHDEYGRIKLGGIAYLLADVLKEHLDEEEIRVCQLGYLQRGGTPNAEDRILATRLGVYATQMVIEKKFGYMVALQGKKITHVPISKVVTKIKTVPKELYELAPIFAI